jgi:uncharacterized membrane protein
VKAKNPSIDAGHTGTGAAIGALTGVFVGLIGGPAGLLLWAAGGGLLGYLAGAETENPFKPMVDDLEHRLASDASMLVPVGETPTIDSFLSALDATEDRVVRAPLTHAG